jgi:hypothetical protein
MRAIEHSTERSVAWGTIASIILHIALGLAVALMPDAMHLKSTPEARINVEIVTFPPPVPAVRSAPVPQESASMANPTHLPSVSDQEAALPPTPGKNPPRLSPSGMIKATRMLSEQWLADPRSREASKMLPLLAADERLEQLCAIEAMAQINAWKSTLRPDRLVAYAMAETKLSRDALLADGAAFHRDQGWYKVKFKCDLSADHTKVVSFKFVVGDVVPRSEWARHNLPAEGGSLD